MKRAEIRSMVALLFSLAIAGCIRTQSEVAVKPVDINLNITGRLELVITDARRQEAEITGEKPKRTVRPEDIGLPPVPPGPGAMGTGESSPLRLVVATADAAEGGDRQAALVRQRAERHPKIEALLGAHLAGESHTGLLVPRGNLSKTQQALVDAENSDRMALYELEAHQKKTAVEQVALGYYLARLEHVSKGTWVERFEKSTVRWEWFQWDR
ncbi:MAG: DUF1318 domain-containing protein [Candidatus Binatia bacterium]